jgi:hypothetical protein
MALLERHNVVETAAERTARILSTIPEDVQAREIEAARRRSSAENVAYIEEARAARARRAAERIRKS